MFSCALPKKWDLPVGILPVQRARAAAGSAPGRRQAARRRCHTHRWMLRPCRWLPCTNALIRAGPCAAPLQGALATLVQREAGW